MPGRWILIATGVLLVGLGRATRLMRFLTALPKTYEAEVVLGTSTSTLDASGEVTGTWDMDGTTLVEVRAAAGSLTGPIEQVPPMVSAVKVGGQRLHTLARAGIEVERAPRPVSVYRFDVHPGMTPGVFRIEVECSSGTYVRVLASDLGQALGGGAHLRNLRRTRIGSFSTGEARPVEELTAAAVLTPAQALRDLDQVVVSDDGPDPGGPRSGPRPGPVGRHRRGSLGPDRRGPPAARRLRGHRHRQDPAGRGAGGGRMSPGGWPVRAGRRGGGSNLPR